MIGYIYSLHGKTEIDVFYVGKTFNPANRAIANRTNYPYYVYDCHVTLSIIEEIEVSDKKELNKHEAYWIQQFVNWGFKLVNYKLHYGKNIRLLEADSESLYHNNLGEMNWKYKLQRKVEIILNSLLKDGYYECFVPTDHKFTVTEDRKICYELETLEHLPSHWMRYADKAVDDIIKEKIDRIEVYPII